MRLSMDEDVSSGDCSRHGVACRGPFKKYLPNWIHEIFEKYIRQDDSEKPINPLEFLEDIRELFPRDKDGNVTPNKVLDDIPELPEGTEETMLELDSECRAMSAFVDRVKEFLKTRTSTLSGPVKRRVCPKKFQNQYYKEFKVYLKEQGFIDKMIDVIHKMFLQHPNIPENPVVYIRDHYGVTKEEELELIKKWLRLKSEIDVLKKENLDLKSRVSEVLSARAPVGRRPAQRTGEEGISSSDSSENLQRKVSGVSYAAKKAVRPTTKSSTRGVLTTLPRGVSERSRVGRESTTKMRPPAKPLSVWVFDAGQEYTGQDSKVPFEPPEYDLTIKWRKKKIPEDLTIEEKEEEAIARHSIPEDDVETSSSSDYSVLSPQPLDE